MSENKIMRICMLDVDGVLNSQIFYESDRYPLKNDPRNTIHNIIMTCLADYKLPVRTERETIDHLKEDLDPLAISFLNDLVTKADAKFVLTSTWRQSHTCAQIEQAMAELGFMGHIIDSTPICGPDTVRGNEILKWLKDNEKVYGCAYNAYHHYVILDDDSDFLYWQRNNFIWVDGYVGLTPTLVYKANYILEGRL